MRAFNTYVKGIRAIRLVREILRATDDFTDGEFLGMVATLIDDYCKNNRKDYKVICQSLGIVLDNDNEVMSA